MKKKKHRNFILHYFNLFGQYMNAESKLDISEQHCF